MSGLEVLPLPGLPEIRPGDELAPLLLEAVRAAGLRLRDGDVLAVTSKVVAKAEGRLVPLPPDAAERERVRREAVATETVRVVARRGPMVIAETRHGLVGANALIDESNAGGAALVLLPEDPDASAAHLRSALASLDGHDVAVVITDTLGRPWRRGQTDVAVGIAGMGAIEDYRGQVDADGRVLEVTEMAVADEVAAAADLVKRKLARTPAALLRGVPAPAGDGRAADLVRPAAEDLFRTGSGAEDLVAFLEGRRTRRRFLPDPVDPDAVQRAVLAAMTAPFPHHTRPFRVVALDSGEGRKRYLTQMGDAWRRDLAGDGTPAEVIERRVARSWALLGGAPVLLVPCLAPGGRHDYPDERRRRAEAAMFELAAGGAVQTLLLALHAQGLGGAWISSSLFCQEVAARALDLPPGWLPLGSVAAGHPDPGDRPRPRPPLDPRELILRR
ncbi:MAG TPA: coenzyme F420-0:L-glutamate ligase [Actinomycetes bacterium]|nr:coenzyme F420-0:L-glutamate ligase [Actinomycetes bacterium]